MSLRTSSNFLFLILFVACLGPKNLLAFVRNAPTCPVQLTDERGNVTNVPVTPGSGQETCSYTIRVSLAAKVEAKFSNVKLGRKNNLIYVFDGSSCHANGWAKIPAGFTDTVVAPKNELSLLTRFTENEDNQMVFSYDSVPENAELPFNPKCGNVVYGDEGDIDTDLELTIPGAPCVYKLKSPYAGRITVSIPRFDTTDDLNELWIYDGPDCASKLLLYVNKNTYSPGTKVTSTGPEVTVLSLSAKTKSPFDLTYFTELIPTKSAPIPTQPVDTTTPGHAVTVKAFATSINGFMLALLLQSFV